MLNFKRINEAFRRYPMCTGELAATPDDDRTQTAVCAVGALIADTGAVTPAGLESWETDEAIKHFLPQLRETYGFKNARQLTAFVLVNDLASDDVPDDPEAYDYETLLEERRELLEDEYNERLIDCDTENQERRVKAWRRRQLREIEAEESVFVRDRLLAYTCALAHTTQSRQLEANP